MREAAGRKIDEAAEALFCSTAKISRLENGKGVPQWRDVRDLVVFYGADERSDLFGLVEDGRSQDWFDSFKDVLHGDMSGDHQQRYFQLEQDASEMKIFEADLIPGLLQSRDYIDAVGRAVFPRHSDRERRRFVEFRLQRQEQVLGKVPAPELSVILSEAAIIRPMGGPDVMRSQLEELHSKLQTSLEAVDFRLFPLTVESRGALGGPFAILKYENDDDEDVVYLEGREGATYLDATGAARYEQLFSELERDSLPRAESLDRLIKEGRAGLRGGGITT
jgi:hypothetical protein